MQQGEHKCLELSTFTHRPDGNYSLLRIPELFDNISLPDVTVTIICRNICGKHGGCLDVIMIYANHFHADIIHLFETGRDQ